MSVKVAPCANCKPHPYQDAKYGQFMRVMNELQGKKPGYRCTVCGMEHL